jgi:hypothetical protein
MKAILTSIILIPLTIFGQTKLDGKYRTETENFYEYFIFNKDSFEYLLYLASDYPSLNKCKGTYKISNNTLILMFNEKDTIKGSYIINEKKCDSLTDSVDIVFNIIASDKNWKSGTSQIWFEDSANNVITNAFTNNGFTEFGITSILTDNNGFYKLRIKKSKENIKVTIGSRTSGFNHCKFNIKPNNCKEITVKLTLCCIGDKETRKYHIKVIDSKKIELREFNRDYSFIYNKQ